MLFGSSRSKDLDKEGLAVSSISELIILRNIQYLITTSNFIDITYSLAEHIFLSVTMFKGG